MGGLFWTCNLIVGHIESFIAVKIYTVYSSTAANPIDSSFLWDSMAILEGSFLFFFALFIRTINPAYISTFFTTMTGKQFACDNFRRATTDEVRFDIFNHSSSYYASIREELRAWLAVNWTLWTVEEKPAWFTPALLSKIPKDLLPKNATQETKELRRKSIDQQRRNSILGVVLQEGETDDGGAESERG